MNNIIQLEKICKTFTTGRKKNQVIHDLTLSVPEGSVFGFLGPNGAGKSTTIKMLLNFIRPEKGIARVYGKQVGKYEFRQHLGYLSEIPCLYDHLTAFETLSFVGGLSGVNKKVLTQRIPLILEKMNLSPAIHQKAGTFSKGMKQRLGFATALIHNPAVFILDEPMSGLDPIGRHHIRNLIFELKEQGKTIFFSSHILSDIESLCDRIGVIHKGHLLYEGTLQAFSKNEDLETAFVGAIKEWDHADIA